MDSYFLKKQPDEICNTASMSVEILECTGNTYRFNPLGALKVIYYLEVFSA